MDDKERLVSNVLLALDENFDSEQLLKVKIALTKNLVDVEVSELTLKKVKNFEESDLLKRYVLRKKTQGFFDSTISVYVRTIKYFMKKVAKSINEIDTNDIRQYLLERKEDDGLSSSSLSREQYNIASFFRWLYAESLIERDPTLNLDIITVRPKSKGIFSKTEVEILRKCAKKEKEKMVIELLLCTGCRVSELVSLRIEDYKKDNESFILRGKNERQVFINAKTKIAIEDYLKKVPHSSGPLILGLKGKAMSINGVQKMIRSIAHKGNIMEANPQKFRRTSAAFAFYHGMDLNDVRLFLGHSDIKTTQRYIMQDVNNLRLAHDKYVSIN